MRIVISAGHGLHVRGASGFLDEVDEARKVVEAVTSWLHEAGVEAVPYQDDISTTQQENLHRIVDFHNSQVRDLDVSVHFNAFETTDMPMGTECLYVSQDTLAWDVSAAIARAGKFVDRGAKLRTDLFFLNSTEMPAILIEVCFVDSMADSDNYRAHFGLITAAIAQALAGDAVPVA